MFCPKCGNILDEGAKFCSSCGAKIELRNETKVNVPCHDHEGTAPKSDSLDPITALKTAMSKITDFSGRSRRSEYWWTAAIVGLAQGILSSAFDGAGTFLSLAATLLVLSVAVRRLHDVGKSGWWYLFNFLPLIGQIILLLQLVKDSAPGNNAYGPNPKGM